MIEKIRKAIDKYKNKQKKQVFLNAALITMTGFSEMIKDYGEAPAWK